MRMRLGRAMLHQLLLPHPRRDPGLGRSQRDRGCGPCGPRATGRGGNAGGPTNRRLLQHTRRLCFPRRSYLQRLSVAGSRSSRPRTGWSRGIRGGIDRPRADSCRGRRDPAGDARLRRHRVGVGGCRGVAAATRLRDLPTPVAASRRCHGDRRTSLRHGQPARHTAAPGVNATSPPGHRVAGGLSLRRFHAWLPCGECSPVGCRA